MRHGLGAGAGGKCNVGGVHCDGSMLELFVTNENHKIEKFALSNVIIINFFLNSL